MGMIDKNEIIRHVREYIREQGGNQGIWYIGQCEEAYGISLNIVKRTSNFWMYIETCSSEVAGEVMDYCINSIGLTADACTSIKNKTGKIVYLYKKENNSSR